MEQLNILVTGGAGFIGSHLVDALVEKGHRVRVLDALVSQVHGDGVPHFVNPAAEFSQGDVCDPDAVRAALENIDVVFHKAAEVGVGQSMYEIVRYVRANDLGTAVLLEELTRNRKQIRKLIVASSMSIYGEGSYECAQCGVINPKLRSNEQLRARQWDFKCPQCGGALTPRPTNEDKPLFPSSVYAISKQDQEQFCLTVGRAYDIPTVALRYFNAYGTRQALSNPYTGVCAIFSGRLLNNQRPMIFEDGDQTRDFVHISDIVQANLLALEKDEANYNVFNVGTGRPISIRQIFQMLASSLGKDIEPEIVGKYREGDIRHCISDISLIRAKLGYEPRVRLEDGIPQLIDWVREQQAMNDSKAAATELEKHQLVR
jgi:dTDP-L-rhamnose 4-epimerase